MQTHSRRIDPIGTAAYVTTVLAWGFVPVFLRSFIHEIDGWTANGVRYGFSALLWLGPMIYWQWRGEYRARHYWALLPIIFVNIAAQILWAWSPYYLEAGLLAFMVRTSTLFSIAFTFILFPRERVLIRSVGFWSGLVVSVAGFVGMTFLGEELPHGATAVGFVIILSCGFMFSMYAIVVRLFMADLTPPQAFSLVCPATAAPLLVLMVIFGDYGQVMDMSGWRIFLLLLSGFLGIAYAHVSYYAALERLGVAIGSSGNLVTPVVTAVLAFFFLGETLTLGQWLSGIMLLTGGGLLVYAQVHILRADRKSKQE